MSKVRRCAVAFAFLVVLFTAGAALAQEYGVDLWLDKEWRSVGGDPISSAVAGEYVVIHIAVGNYGEVGTAYNVVVEDFLPAGIIPLDYDYDQGSLMMGVPGNPDRPLTWNVGTVYANDTYPVDLSIYAQVDPSIADGVVLWNDAAVYPDNYYAYEYNNSDNVDSAGLEINTSADLEVEIFGPYEETQVGPAGIAKDIQKQVMLGDIVAGTVITYEVDVTNYGPSVARSVKLWDWVQHGLKIQGARIVGGDGTAAVLNTEEDGSDLVVDLGDMAPIPEEEIIEPAPGIAPTTAAAGTDTGRRMIFVDMLVLPEAYWYASSLWNDAEVISGDWEYEYTDDPDDENNYDEFYSDVIGMVDIAIAKTADVTSVIPGGTIAYTITATNNGPSDAAYVTVMDEVPYGTTIIGVTTGQDDYLEYDEDDLWWGLLTLRAGESATLQLIVSVTSDPDFVGDTLYNEAWYEFESIQDSPAPADGRSFGPSLQPIEGYYFDPNEANNEAIAAVRVVVDPELATLPDLTCEWMGYGSMKRSGRSVDGILIVTNQGTGIAGRFQVYLGVTEDDETMSVIDKIVTIKSLAPGASVYLRVKHKFDRRFSKPAGGSGLYFMGIVDPQNSVEESIENNNVDIWGEPI